MSNSNNNLTVNFWGESRENFHGHVKSWSRKEKCAENERVSPQVTLPLK